MKFGLPKVIIANNGPVFISKTVRSYAEKIRFRVLHSTPNCPESNGQAEASNKVIQGRPWGCATKALNMRNKNDEYICQT